VTTVHAQQRTTAHIWTWPQFCEAYEPVLLLFTQISTCTKFLPILQYYFVSSTLFVYIKEHWEQDQCRCLTVKCRLKVLILIYVLHARSTLCKINMWILLLFNLVFWGSKCLRSLYSKSRKNLQGLWSPTFHHDCW